MPSSAWRSTLFPYTTLFRSDRKSTRLNSSHDQISYAVFCLKKKKYRDDIGFGNPHARIPTKDFVSAEKQIEFLLQRDGTRIHFDRSCVLYGAPNRTHEMHG